MLELSPVSAGQACAVVHPIDRISHSRDRLGEDILKVSKDRDRRCDATQQLSLSTFGFTATQPASKH